MRSTRNFPQIIAPLRRKRVTFPRSRRGRSDSGCCQYGVSHFVALQIAAAKITADAANSVSRGVENVKTWHRIHRYWPLIETEGSLKGSRMKLVLGGRFERISQKRNAGDPGFKFLSAEEYRP
jgi:hypothetical protein